MVNFRKPNGQIPALLEGFVIFWPVPDTVNARLGLAFLGLSLLILLAFLGARCYFFITSSGSNGSDFLAIILTQFKTWSLLFFNYLLHLRVTKPILNIGRVEYGSVLGSKSEVFQEFLPSTRLFFAVPGFDFLKVGGFLFFFPLAEGFDLSGAVVAVEFVGALDGIADA